MIEYKIMESTSINERSTMNKLTSVLLISFITAVFASSAMAVTPAKHATTHVATDQHKIAQAHTDKMKVTAKIEKSKTD